MSDDLKVIERMINDMEPTWVILESIKRYALTDSTRRSGEGEKWPPERAIYAAWLVTPPSTEE